MTLIPHYVQNEIEAGDDPQDLRNFNFCSPADMMLPFHDGDIDITDQEHFLGLAVATTTEAPFVPYPHPRGGYAGAIMMRGGMQ